MTVIQPYYEDESITIYHGDCRVVLPALTADVLVTDPPYGVGMDAYHDDFDVAVEGMAQAPGYAAAMFASPRRVYEAARRLDGYWKWERLLWMHKTADMAAPWHGWCMNSEAILILSRPEYKWPKASHYRSDVYTVGPWERGGHPNGKPLTVVTDLVSRMTVIGSVVLDPFMGSGTTLVAAKALGRKAIGIEVEERYCEIAAKRLAQGVLPLEAA